MISQRRCNLDGQPLSEHDQAQVDAFARFLREQARTPLAGGLAWERLPRFAQDADLTVYWPAVRPCWESRPAPVRRQMPAPTAVR